jgi:putative ubiquitin-RnfH superfamily antitoxin RatB of RatAB toxin-antitoxin module
VTVAYAAPGVEALVPMVLQAPASVADAVLRSRIVQRHGLDPATLGYAIYGQRADATTPLADGDRVEITRPLVVDPKAARVERARSRAMAMRHKQAQKP